jgi:hypothetical protein
MSTASEAARTAAKSKAERLVRSDPLKAVDASGYRPDGAMDADVQTGPRPISRRQFRRGGQVEGEKSTARADRKPRASGGRNLTADSFLNRDVKEANKEREGIKHIGGMKRGGRTGKLGGGPLIQNTGSPSMPPTVMGRKEGGKVHVSGCGCAKCGGGRVEKAEGGAIYGGTRPVAGRLARKGGGRTKGKTNVNIIITQPGGMSGGAPMPPPGAMPPPGGPVGLHQGAPPPAVMGPPAGAPPPMMRKSGGRTVEHKAVKPGAYPIDSGGGGGLGRLEKAKAYG